MSIGVGFFRARSRFWFMGWRLDPFVHDSFTLTRRPGFEPVQVSEKSMDFGFFFGGTP